MDINWKQMWTAVGIVFAIVASTVSITLVVTSGQISGLERSLAQLERSQAQQAENLLALMNAQNESVLAQLRLLNDKMTNIETEHVELRTLYERVGALQTEVAYIKDDVSALQSDVKTMRADLDTVRANQDTMRANQDTMRADLDALRANQDTMRADIDKILTILESGE